MSNPNASRTAISAIALVATLVSIYIVSQFLRNSIGVIAPNLAAEIALSPGEIGLLSSTFFLAFAAVQIPLGLALDRFGPRLCLMVGAGITVAGTIAFACAANSGVLILARALLGLGSAGSLMASLAVYAKQFPPERFATLTGLQFGLGTVGTLLATAPLAFSAATIGWRASFLLVGGFTLLVGLAIAAVLGGGTSSAAIGRETWRDSLSGIIAVVRTRSVARLFAMNLVTYSTFALIVGLWGGPYLAHIYGYGLEERGTVLLIPVLAQIAGSMAWGPMERLMGGYKLPVLIGAGATAAALGGLAAAGTLTPPTLVAWFAAFGFVAAYNPVLIAHGKALFAPHQVGRGLTLLNVASMGGTFLTQAASGYAIELFPVHADDSYDVDAYRLVFGLQALFIILALLVYLPSREPARGPSKG
jgi:MFS family permease